MFKRLAYNLKHKYIDVKCLIKRYRWIYILGIASVLFGILMAIMKLDSQLERYSNGNLILQMQSESFNAFTFYLKLLLIPAALIAIGFLLTVNYYVFFGNFLVLMLFIRGFLKAVIAACILDGFTAYILLLFLWIPLFVLVVFSFLTYLALLYQLTGNPCSKKRLVPYSAYWSGTKKILLNTLTTVAVITFLYSSLILIILSIFF